MDDTLNCPNCGSTQVTTTHEQLFYVNTGDHYCHRVKTHDGDSRALCVDCDWQGIRDDLFPSSA